AHCCPHARSELPRRAPAPTGRSGHLRLSPNRCRRIVRMNARDLFTTVRTEGGLLPTALLQRIVRDDRELPGLHPDTYHLAGERLQETVSRAWHRLCGAWASFRATAAKLPEQDVGTTLTRERWLLILFQELGYGRLVGARAVELEDKTYPISHFWHRS